MPATARRGAYIWVTWITGLLAGEDSCGWAAWFQAHFTFDAAQRDGNDLARWKAEHRDMVQARVAELEADGWTVSIEDQNAFKVKGRQVAALLSGKPDIIATRGADALVVDCKGGQRRDKDFWQVAIYLMFLPFTHPMVCAGRRVVGELRYRDSAVLVPPEDLTPTVHGQITRQLMETGGIAPPRKRPSGHECGFCKIGAADCPERVALAAAATTLTDLF